MSLRHSPEETNWVVKLAKLNFSLSRNLLLLKIYCIKRFSLGPPVTQFYLMDNHESIWFCAISIATVMCSFPMRKELFYTFNEVLNILKKVFCTAKAKEISELPDPSNESSASAATSNTSGSTETSDKDRYGKSEIIRKSDKPAEEDASVSKRAVIDLVNMYGKSEIIIQSNELAVESTFTRKYSTFSETIYI